jgi:hypothetical protein
MIKTKLAAFISIAEKSVVAQNQLGISKELKPCD